MMKKRGLWEIVILTLIIGLGIQIAPDIASACGSCGVPEGCGSRGVSDEGCGSCGVPEGCGSRGVSDEGCGSCGVPEGCGSRGVSDEGCGSCGVVAPAKKEIKESSSSKVNTIEEIKGELTCIGCELKSHEGARAQCKVYGHKYGFKLKDGSLWSFIENDRSKLLISNKVPGKNIIKVTIYGRKFPKVHYIDVDHFKVCEKGPKEKVICKEYVWCIVFKRMEKAWGKVSYEGKTYNVCCPGCKKSFNKNPKKYVHEEAPSEKHEPKKHEHE